MSARYDVVVDGRVVAERLDAYDAADVSWAHREAIRERGESGATTRVVMRRSVRREVAS